MMGISNEQRKVKTKTSSEYHRRITLSLRYINEHLDERLHLNDIASVSYFSSYHFHRIFHALVGETVNDYVSRKRMERAINRLLANKKLSITEVSVLGGFSSSANFSKAFKLYFGLSPSQLRHSSKQKNSKIGKLYRKYGKEFNHQDLYSQFVTQNEVFASDKLEELLMKIKIKDLDEKKIAYLTAAKGYDLSSVFETWDKIVQWANNQNINTEKQHCFAICHDNPVITPEDKCRYDAAIVVDSSISIASPINESVIPSGKYAIAYFKDVAEKISPFMTELCAQWFPDSGYEPDDYPPLFNYLNDSRKEGGTVEMNVYIKIKALETHTV